MPTPTDGDQQRLLQTVWDLFATYSRWPTFAQVDRKLDRDFDLDAQVVSQRLPAELLYPRVDGWLAPDRELGLTIAGAVACSGSQEDVRYFLEVVRFAAELERSWPGRPTEETDEPILTSADVVQRVQLPAAGREALLRRLSHLLTVEDWGWRSASPGGPDWQFELSRQVRRFRGVSDLDQYWSIRTRQTEQPSPRRLGDERGSELGGAWALEKSTYPIVVPPLTRSEAVAQIGDVHMGQLGSEEEIDDVFDELQDRLRNDVGLSTTATAWNPVARRFKEGLPAVLAALAAAAAPPAAMPSAPPPSASSRPPSKITVDNYAVVPTGIGTEVQGEATNNDTVEHSALLKATLYDESGKIVDTADGAVSQLAPGETKTFSLLSLNAVQQYARLKVQVDAVY